MRPAFRPALVNGPTGDPALYVDFVFQRRALLFDMGDLAALPTRKLLRVSEAFLSHAHMDHFMGFDQLLRVLVGRERTVRLYGPPGLIGQVAGRLRAYTWNLVDRFEAELRFVVTEYHGHGWGRRARLRLGTGFALEAEGPCRLPGGVLLEEPGLRVRAAVLDHGIPCLGFVLEEGLHVNVWRNRLEELGLDVGPWLQALKRGVLEGRPEEEPVPVRWLPGRSGPPVLPLGELRRRVLRVVPGQRIGYLTDLAGHAANRRAAAALVRGADLLYIECPFPHREAARAADRRHLTARQAGLIARAAAVQRVVPFHLSPRHQEEAEALVAELEAVWRGEAGLSAPA